MKAPYLTIAGKSANVGEKYFEVRALDGALFECVAERQNNVIGSCYFLNKEMANHYKWMIELRALLTKQIEAIESDHKGK